MTNKHMEEVGMVSVFTESVVECKKELYGGKEANVLMFKKGESYPVRITGKSAVVKDETGCWRPLYNDRDDKFYKENFKPM